MADPLTPVIAGAGLAFTVLFVMAVANGMTSLVLGQTIDAWVGSKIGGAE